MAYTGLAGCERMARNLMQVHGLPAEGPGAWQFRWSHAKRQAGSCSYKSRVIRLSRPIAELWGPEGMRDTILHEIAHAKAGYKAAHGPAWRDVCRQIGAEPKACFEVTEETLMPPMRYTGTCPAGHTLRRDRLPRRLTTCGKCAPRFDVRYMVTWAEN